MVGRALHRTQPRGEPRPRRAHLVDVESFEEFVVDGEPGQEAHKGGVHDGRLCAKEKGATVLAQRLLEPRELLEGLAAQGCLVWRVRVVQPSVAVRVEGAARLKHLLLEAVVRRQLMAGKLGVEPLEDVQRLEDNLVATDAERWHIPARRNLSEVPRLLGSRGSPPR